MFDHSYVRAGETAVDLGRGGYMLIQPKRGYKFGTDAVLLAAFAAGIGERRCLDLCAGSGVVSLLMLGRRNLAASGKIALAASGEIAIAASGKIADADFVGIELQRDYADMAERSFAANGLNGRARIIPGDVRDIRALTPAASFDVVTANPPYIPANGGLPGADASVDICRRETACTLADVARAAKYALRPGGSFVCVHRPKRLGDIFEVFGGQSLGITSLRFVHPKADRAPTALLVHARRGMRPELNVLPPLILRDADGGYTREARSIYND
ncbi:MAG: hypothetical protein LBK41_08195 [Clostridiales bacterium]|jgi:tRNA1Val (adenine37-N6)-methyltransferase|nr:hypothetical protein [Clostridiales bacterium]